MRYLIDATFQMSTLIKITSRSILVYGTFVTLLVMYASHDTANKLYTTLRHLNLRRYKRYVIVANCLAKTNKNDDKNRVLLPTYTYDPVWVKWKLIIYQECRRTNLSMKRKKQKQYQPQTVHMELV